MPVAASAVWEVRASGAGVSDNNGGAWQPLTVSTFSGTDLVVDGSVATKVTSVTHNFVAADVGTRLLISGPAATAWVPGFYTILSVAANAATLNTSPAPVSTTGGVWNEVGADFSQQNAPQVAVGGGVVTSSITTNVITFTGATYAPTNADVGNTVQVISGTNTTPGTFLQITATTSTTWTMSGNVVSAGTATNVVANMGGALLTLAKLAAATAMVASNKAYCTGAFSATTTTTFAQTVTPTGAAPASRLIGYGVTRGDALHATLTMSGAGTVTGIATTGNGWNIEQFDVDCASIPTSTGISGTGNYLQIRNCKAANFTVRGISLGAAAGPALISDCEVTGGGSGGTAGIDSQDISIPTEIIRCFVHDNACLGIKMVTYCTVTYCLIANNSGTSDGISTTHSCQILNNTIHNNGRDGIRLTAGNSIDLNIRNNIFSNNGGIGLNNAFGGTAFPDASEYDGNAYWSNTGGTRAGFGNMAGIYAVTPYTNVRDVTLSASPYIGPTTGSTANFALNAVAGGGAACRKAGSPSTWPGNTGTTGFPDFGAVQTASGGGSPGIIVPV